MKIDCIIFKAGLDSTAIWDVGYTHAQYMYTVASKIYCMLLLLLL